MTSPRLKQSTLGLGKGKVFLGLRYGERYVMNVFQTHYQIVQDYSSYIQSFLNISDPTIRRTVEPLKLSYRE